MHERQVRSSCNQENTFYRAESRKIAQNALARLSVNVGKEYHTYKISSVFFNFVTSICFLTVNTSSLWF